MSMRDELREMGKGIRGVEKHNIVMGHIDFIKDNFIKKYSHSGDVEEYIKEIKPQSIRDAVMVKLVSELNNVALGYTNLTDHPDNGKRVNIRSTVRQMNVVDDIEVSYSWSGTIVSRSEATITIRADEKSIWHEPDPEIKSRTLTFDLSKVIVISD